MNNENLKKIFTLIKNHLASTIGKVENKSSAEIRAELTKDNVTTALGYTPSKDGHGHTIANVTDLQSSLDSKVPTTRKVNGKVLSGDITLSASDVGLENVNNTSDANKPVSTAQQTAINNALSSAKTYTDGKIDAIVGTGASTTLDTIGEISKAIEEHQDVTDALNSAIGNKVDKISGKGLSTNDYTTTEKNKLAGIAEGANKYTLPSAGSSLGGVKSGGDVTITDGIITVNDDSHNHLVSNIDGLQTALDNKANFLDLGQTYEGVQYQVFASTPSNNLSENTHATFLISGVGNFGGTKQGSCLVTISNRNSTATMEVTVIAPWNSGTVTFGYYKSDSNFYFGVYSSAYRGNLTVVTIQNIGVTVKSHYNSATAPDGWTSVTPRILQDSNSDTKNTAGSTDSSSKLFLIGATSQAANPQTYSHDTVYVGTDGCLYSNSSRVIIELQATSEPSNQNTGDHWLLSY